MARVAWISALILDSCASPSATPPSSKNADGDDRASWTEAPDFLNLRTSYGDREDFNSLCEESRPLARMFSAANAADWITLVAIAETWLASCPVDLDAHFLIAIALSERGAESEAQHHVRWYQGLLESILASGDGRSAESPHVVISVSEEYSVLRAFRLEFQNQRLLEGGIDAIAAETGTGEAVTLYFLPRAHWKRLEREFGE